jgi:hypothetical protein
MAGFPTTLDAITPDWLTGVLASDLDGARVTDIAVQPVGAGVGFMASMARLALTYDRPCAGAPGTVIAKVASLDPGAIHISSTFRFYEKETRFYDELAAHTDMRTPRAFLQAFDPEAGNFALLLEDLAPARNGDQVAGLSVADAGIALEALGRMHARWWESPKLKAMDWLPDFDSPTMRALLPVFQQCWNPYRDFMAERLSAPMRPLGDRLTACLPRILTHLTTLPVTLVHGDYRADNFFYGEGDDAFTVVDWQIILQGPGAFDVAYLLTGNLSVADRRASGEALVRRYHDALVAGGVAGYDFEACWRDVRLCTIFAWMWPVIAVGSLDPANERGVAFFFEWSHRVCSAIQDLKADEMLRGFED